jgi:hypothetical protein
MAGILMSVEQAWAAGLFEGEGCITVVRTDRGVEHKYPSLQIEMTDEEPVRRFFEIVGVGTFKGPYRPPSMPAANKAIWTWRVSGKKARAIMEWMYPLLMPRRQQRWDEVS